MAIKGTNIRIKLKFTLAIVIGALLIFFPLNTAKAVEADTPVMDPTTSNFNDTVSVTITSGTPGATIYYTTNGSTPDSNSTEYVGSLLIDSTTTLKAIAYADGFDPSLVATEVFTLVVPNPILTPAGGTFDGSVNVDVNPQNQDVTMYYTTDGSTPDSSDSVFNMGTIEFTQTTVFKIVSYLRGSVSSVVTGNYTVNPIAGNEPPAATDQYLSTNKNVPLNILLTYADSDGPGPYAVTIGTAPANGGLTNMGDSDDKTWTYTPDNNYTGTDTFTYTVSDSEDVSETGTITINVTEAGSGGIVVDYEMVDTKWDDLVADTDMIATIKTKKVSFKHASVGANIWDGLKCLGQNYATRPNYCDVNEDGFSGDYYSNSMFSIDFNNDGDIYNDVSFYFHNETPVNVNPGNPNPAWWNKILYFIDGVTSRESGDYGGPYDIYSFKMGYVDGDDSSTIDDMAFNPSSPQSTFFDIQDVEDNYPSKVIVYTTMGVARGIGTFVSQSFNNQLRAYTSSNNKFLYDIADIESHYPNGATCTSDSGYENLCDGYTSESFGGHLNGLGKFQAAKSFWLMMACASGWDQCGGSVTTNQAPLVFAGVDTSVDVNVALSIDGAAVDDGLPASPGTISYTWTKQSGPGSANFANASSSDTTVTFDTAGTYIIRLTASDGDQTSYSQITVTVNSVSITGDINGDSTVNLLDYIVLSNNFGTADAPSDLNSDGTVNLLDYVILSNNFGQSG